MLKWVEKKRPAVFFAFCILLMFHAGIAKAESDVSFEITAIESRLDGNALQYKITGKNKPAYNVTERFAPFRVVVDIAGASYGKGVSDTTAHLPSNVFSSLKIKDLETQTPKIKRFIFQLAESHDYTVADISNGVQISFLPSTGSAPAKSGATPSSRLTLKDFKIKSTPNSTTISIVADRSIKDYTVDTIGKGANTPPRMYIDIDDVGINELVREKMIGTSVAKVRVASRGKGVRFVFDSATETLFQYSVVSSPSGLDIVVNESGAPSKKKSKSPGDATLDELISSSEQLLTKDPNELAARTSDKASALADDFSFSGFKKQRISVDFYKIDIHNVFRLFREITDLNIIIDEDVAGSLTLALNDVPWDFALDIILNLMDLKKEEKYNTIVIYPATKKFVWPTRAEDNLAFEADLEVIEQEALVIEKTSNTSPKILEAQKLLREAKGFEKREDYETAVSIYTKALKLWPNNANISNQLATMYLVHLRVNAKAVYYAKKSLKIDPDNTKAALYAAIGSANMQRINEAKEYFTQAISGSPPMKEALASYAAFAENNNLNQEALRIIAKHTKIYGEDLNTMIAKARIFDKLGLSQKATQQYKEILTSGFQLTPALKKYVVGRTTVKNDK